MKKIESDTTMILGGYGGAGFNIAQLLLQETQQRLILAGRNYTKAAAAAERLNARFDGNRVQGMRVDAANSDALKDAFQNCDTVVVCVPITASGIGGGVVQAAFDAGINYVDINLDENKQRLLQHLGERIKQSGQYFMTEAGLMPGLPSTMVAAAAKRFDALQSLQFGFLERENSGGYGSALDLMVYAADPAYVYKQGAWRKVPTTASKRIDFGPGLGKQTCYPMDLYELRPLPDRFGLKEVGFYAAGLNPVTDLILFSWIVFGLHKFKWSLHLGAKLGIWTARKFTKPPYTTTLLVEAKGKVNNHDEKAEIVISHQDGYEATAVAAVAGILQLLDGSIREPGVKIMGHCVDPDRYFEDIKRMGMTVRIQQNDLTTTI